MTMIGDPFVRLDHGKEAKPGLADDHEGGRPQLKHSKMMAKALRGNIRDAGLLERIRRQRVVHRTRFIARC
jgi:hypothetical protein